MCIAVACISTPCHQSSRAKSGMGMLSGSQTSHGSGLAGGLWAVLLPELCQVVVEMWELSDIFNMCGPLFCSALHAPGHVRPCSGCKHAPSKLLGVWEAMPHPQRQGPEGLHGRPPVHGCWAALWPGGGGVGVGTTMRCCQGIMAMLGGHFGALPMITTVAPWWHHGGS